MQNYYDYAASTPMSSEVEEAMLPWFSCNFANPSASHDAGRKAFQAIQQAREVIADKISAMPSEIIFTSGASEANNLALKGVAFQNLEHKGHIITSSIEHKCVLNTCQFLEQIGFQVTYLKPDSNGLINVKDIEDSLCSNTLLVSIHHINNELGVMQPIAEFGEFALENNVLFHTDAAQSFCKVDIDVDEQNLDFLSLSAHKIYGPKGIGALYVRDARNSDVMPLIHGGGQELGLRGGTLPTPLIMGLGAAVRHFPSKPVIAQACLEESLKGFSYQRNAAEQAIESIWNITFDSLSEAQRFQKKNQWLLAQGSACNAMTNAPSHVLTAIGLTNDQARLSYRISLPPFCLSGI